MPADETFDICKSMAAGTLKLLAARLPGGRLAPKMALQILNNFKSDLLSASAMSTNWPCQFDLQATSAMQEESKMLPASGNSMDFMETQEAEAAEARTRRPRRPAKHIASTQDTLR